VLVRIRSFRSLFAVRQQVATSALALASLLLIGPAAVAQGTPPAADGPPSPQIIDDRTLGEGDRHERRHEWFFSSRRAGTSSDSEMAELRLAGVEATRNALRAQSQRRAATGFQDVDQNFWFSKGPSPSNFGGWAFGTVAGRVSTIAGDWAGGALYLGTASGGLWKSTNDGVSWTQLFDSAGTMTIGTVAVDPNDPDVIWAGTGENGRGCEDYFGVGLLRSADGGATWEPRNGTGFATLNEMASFANVIVDPRDSNHIITGGRIRGCSDGSSSSGGLYTSTNAGLTWVPRIADAELYEIAQDPTVLDIYWAATSSGIYKSINNGVDWTRQTASGLPSGGGIGRTELAIAPSDGNTVYALFSTGGNSLWRTEDGGASWSQRSTGGNACDGQCWYNMVLRVHRTDPSTVYRGTIHVFKSTNGGANWSDLSNNWGSTQTVHQDTHHLLMHPTSPNTFYVGSDGGVWKTSNGGSSFTNRNGNLNITQFYAVGADAQNPDVICGGAQDNSSLVRTNSDVWDLQTVTGDGFVCHIDPQDSNIFYITSYPGTHPRVFRSTDGPFGSYVYISGLGSGINSGDRSNWVTPYLLDPTSPNILYLGTQRMYRSVNYGNHWTAQGPGDMTGGSGSLFALEINRNFPTYLYAGSVSGRVWRTENSGTDWNDITAGLPGRRINDIAADPTDPDRAFAVVGGFNTAHLWEWTATDGWTARDGGLPNVPANSVLMLSGTDIMVGTDTGVFRSSDGGVTFEPYMNGLPQGLVVTDLKADFANDMLTAGTYGRGAWQVHIAPTAANVRFHAVELPMVEEDGDGDDKIEPGETWQVRPFLRNVGGQTALGVTARLQTSTPGVTILEPQSVSFGDLDPGEDSAPAAPFRFAVDPGFTCGADAIFDLVEIESTSEPEIHPDQIGIFSVTVVGTFLHPSVNPIVDEDFGGETGSDWTVHLNARQQDSTATPDGRGQWRNDVDGGQRGGSYHVGGSAGGGQAWLHLGGVESKGGAGIEIPRDALSARLSITHAYEMGTGGASGRVVIDGIRDGRDDYVVLKQSDVVLADRELFRGSSAGSVTSTFDLTKFKGRRLYIAFVYDGIENGELEDGWTIDQASVEFLGGGLAFCDLTLWPGSVPNDVQFNLVGTDGIEAAWGDSCNAGAVPGQTYSVQVGDLDALHAGGTYSHAPVDARCDLVSPASFTAGAGNEYYLIAPNADGREGGQGVDSSGSVRPQSSALCGERREGSCP
jgi:hypothetical protein